MFAWFNFAHHPLCKNYKKEVITINGMYLCKGCTEVYSTGILTFLLVFLFNPLPPLNLVQLFLVGFIAVSPSILGNIIHFKHRIIKDIIRIMLGIGVGIALSEFLIIQDLVTKIGIVIIFLIIYYCFKFTRSKQIASYHNDLCPDCTQFNEHACEPYKRVFVTEREYSRVLSDFIQKRLSANQLQGMGFRTFNQDDD